MKTINFSVVENFKLTNICCTEEQLISGLKGQKMKSRIEPLRQLINNKEYEKADDMKKQLPALLISGVFNGGRMSSNLVEYSHVICLDLDKIEVNELQRLKDKVANCSYTFATFISPSGLGLKILVKVDSGSNYHKEAYKQVVKHYSKLIDRNFDEKTCDINRLTFMSYDSEPYHYPDSDVFPIETPIQSISKNIEEATSIVQDYGRLYESAYKFTCRKEDYHDGNRNNFMFLLAHNCNRCGIPKEKFLKLISWCDLPEGEVKNTVENAYKRKDQFGMLQQTVQRRPLPFGSIIDSAQEILIRAGIYYVHDMLERNTEVAGLQRNEPLTDIEYEAMCEPFSPEIEAAVNQDSSSETDIAVTDCAQDNSILDDASPKDDSDMHQLPNFPMEVYDLLPGFLKKMSERFQYAIEKDLVLISSLSVLSAAFPFVHGTYDRSKVSLNLFLFVVAPPSAGKGQMKWAWALVNKIDKHLEEKYKQEYKCYSEQPDKFKEPVNKMFSIPANTSSAAIVRQMAKNENFGLIFDNEGDTLAQMMKNDWSNFSPLLRKAFQNEPFSQLRKAEADSSKVDRTSLSVVLSGTPNQVPRLIDSVEDGLFSRFMFYLFDHELKWKDKFCSEQESLEPLFEQAAEYVLKMWRAGESGRQTTISVSPEQRKKINHYFSRRLADFYQKHGADIVPNVFRTCLIWYRLAMILTTIRAYEMNNQLPEKLTIDDRDYQAAFLITDALLSYLRVVFENVMQANSPRLKGKRNELISELSNKFKKSDYIQAAIIMGIKKPTAEKYLLDYQKLGIIRKIDAEHGWYEKVA